LYSSIIESIINDEASEKRMAISVVAETGSISREELYNTIMYEIQKRMVDIESNKDQKRPIHDEIADMMVLVSKLSEMESVDDSIIEQRRLVVEKNLR
jgi:hypothetical protein